MAREMTTWRELLTTAMGEHDEASLNNEFCDGYGLNRGDYFTLWTKSRVYFPVDYDGAEWVGSVPRNPCGEASAHFGGGGC